MPRKVIKFLSLLICFCLIFEQSGFAQVAGELDISGHITQLRDSLIQDKFRPLHLRYLSYDNLSNNFKLLLDKGDLKNLRPQELESSTKSLLNFFFVGISLPNDSFWVNLRPDSPEQIIDDALATTDVGKILLEADLQLKKDTAKFTSPETPEGKEYWDKLYKKAEEIFGSSNITIPTLTRPWIVPDEIIIRETQDNAYIYKATLKVMLEQDYLKGSAVYNFNDERLKELNEYSSQLIREIIIPKLTKEINTSKRYASLRQVYYSLILAQWFKSRFYGRGGLYSWLIDKKNLNGITSKENWSKSTYFKAYQQSFKDGEYNLKTPVSTPYGQTIRSYFSGGINFDIGQRGSSPLLAPGVLQIQGSLTTIGGVPTRTTPLFSENKNQISGIEVSSPNTTENPYGVEIKFSGSGQLKESSEETASSSVGEDLKEASTPDFKKADRTSYIKKLFLTAGLILFLNLMPFNSSDAHISPKDISKYVQTIPQGIEAEYHRIARTLNINLYSVFALDLIESAGSKYLISPKGAIGPNGVMPIALKHINQEIKKAVKSGNPNKTMKSIIALLGQKPLSMADLKNNPTLARRVGVAYYKWLLDYFNSRKLVEKTDGTGWELKKRQPWEKHNFVLKDTIRHAYNGGPALVVNLKKKYGPDYYLYIKSPETSKYASEFDRIKADIERERLTKKQGVETAKKRQLISKSQRIERNYNKAPQTYRPKIPGKNGSSSPLSESSNAAGSPMGKEPTASSGIEDKDRTYLGVRFGDGEVNFPQLEKKVGDINNNLKKAKLDLITIENQHKSKGAELMMMAKEEEAIYRRKKSLGWLKKIFQRGYFNNLNSQLIDLQNREAKIATEIGNGKKEIAQIQLDIQKLEKGIEDIFGEIEKKTNNIRGNLPEDLRAELKQQFIDKYTSPGLDKKSLEEENDFNLPEDLRAELKQQLIDKYISPELDKKEKERKEKHYYREDELRHRIEQERKDIESQYNLDALRDFDKIVGVMKDAGVAYENRKTAQDDLDVIRHLLQILREVANRSIQSRIDETIETLKRQVEKLKNEERDRIELAVETIADSLRIEKYLICRDNPKIKAMLPAYIMTEIDKVVINKLIEGVFGRNPESAIMKLMQMKAPQALFPLILSALADPDEHVRAGTVLALSNLISEPEMKAEIERLRKEKVPGLGRIIDVIEKYTPEQEKEIYRTKELLTHYGEDLLIDLLNSDNENLRRYAIYGLSPHAKEYLTGQNQTRAAKALSKALVDDRNIELRSYIIETLWNRVQFLGEDASLEVLVSNVNNPDRTISSEIVRRSVWIHDKTIFKDMAQKYPELVDAFFEFGKSGDKTEKRAAAHFFSQVDDYRARRLLEEMSRTVRGELNRSDLEEIGKDLIKNVATHTDSLILKTLLGADSREMIGLRVKLERPEGIESLSLPLSSFEKESPENRQKIVSEILNLEFNNPEVSQKISAIAFELEKINPLVAQNYILAVVEDRIKDKENPKTEILVGRKFTENLIKLSRVSVLAARAFTSMVLEHPEKMDEIIAYFSSSDNVILQELTAVKASPRGVVPTEEISFDKLFSLEQRDYLPLAYKLLASRDGSLILGEKKIKDILGVELKDLVDSLMQVSVTWEDIELVKQMLTSPSEDELYCTFFLAKYGRDDKNDPVRIIKETIKRFLEDRGLPILMHGTTIEARDAISQGLVGGKIAARTGLAGMYATIESKEAVNFSNEHSLLRVLGQSREGINGGLLYILSSDIYDSHVYLEPDLHLTAVRFVDNKGRLVRAPNRMMYAMETTAEEMEEKGFIEIARAIKQRSALKAIEGQLLNRLKMAILSEPGLRETIEEIYKRMRRHNFPEPKIIEVVDSYIRFALTSDKANPKDQSYKLRLLMEQAMRADGTSLNKLHDLLLNYPELVAQLDPTQPFEENLKSIDNYLCDLSVKSMTKVDEQLGRGVVAAEVSERHPGLHPIDLSNVLVPELNYEGPNVEEKIMNSVRVIFNEIAEKRHNDFKEIIKQSMAELDLEGLERPPQDSFDLVLTASTSRREATPFSDLDIFLLIRDIKTERNYTPYFDRLETKILNRLEELGYGLDPGAMQRVGLRITFEDLDEKIKAVDKRMAQVVEPTTMMDIEPVTAGSLAREMKEIAFRKYEIEKETLLFYLETEIKKFIRLFKEGSSQAISGDAVPDIKNAFTRIMPFITYYMIVSHIPEIRQFLFSRGLTIADMPNATSDRFDLLKDIGLLSEKESFDLKRAYLGIQRQRFKTSVVEETTHGAEVDPLLFTTRERENFESYIKIISDFIETMKISDQPVIISPAVAGVPSASSALKREKEVDMFIARIDGVIEEEQERLDEAKLRLKNAQEKGVSNKDIRDRIKGIADRSKGIEETKNFRKMFEGVTDFKGLMDILRPYGVEPKGIQKEMLIALKNEVPELEEGSVLFINPFGYLGKIFRFYNNRGKFIDLSEKRDNHTAIRLINAKLRDPFALLDVLIHEETHKMVKIKITNELERILNEGITTYLTKRTIKNIMKGNSAFAKSVRRKIVRHLEPEISLLYEFFGDSPETDKDIEKIINSRIPYPREREFVEAIVKRFGEEFIMSLASSGDLSLLKDKLGQAFDYLLLVVEPMKDLYLTGTESIFINALRFIVSTDRFSKEDLELIVKITKSIHDILYNQILRREYEEDTDEHFAKEVGVIVNRIIASRLLEKTFEDFRGKTDISAELNNALEKEINRIITAVTTAMKKESAGSPVEKKEAVSSSLTETGVISSAAEEKGVSRRGFLKGLGKIAATIAIPNTLVLTPAAAIGQMFTKVIAIVNMDENSIKATVKIVNDQKSSAEDIEKAIYALQEAAVWGDKKTAELAERYFPTLRLKELIEQKDMSASVRKAAIVVLSRGIGFYNLPNSSEDNFKAFGSTVPTLKDIVEHHKDNGLRVSALAGLVYLSRFGDRREAQDARNAIKALTPSLKKIILDFKEGRIKEDTLMLSSIKALEIAFEFGDRDAEGMIREMLAKNIFATRTIADSRIICIKALIDGFKYNQHKRGFPIVIDILDENPLFAERLIESINYLHDQRKEGFVREIVKNSDTLNNKGLYLLLAEGSGFYTWTFNELFNELISRTKTRSFNNYIANVDPSFSRTAKFILTLGNYQKLDWLFENAPTTLGIAESLLLKYENVLIMSEGIYPIFKNGNSDLKNKLKIMIDNSYNNAQGRAKKALGLLLKIIQDKGAINKSIFEIPYRSLIKDNTITLAVAFRESAQPYQQALNKALTGQDSRYWNVGGYNTNKNLENKIFRGKENGNFVLEKKIGELTLRVIAGDVDTIARVIQENKIPVNILSTRSHSYEFLDTLKDILGQQSDAELIIMPGACGSYKEIVQLFEAYPNAKFITNPGVDQGDMVNLLSYFMLDFLGRKEAKIWEDLRKSISRYIEQTVKGRIWPDNISQILRVASEASSPLVETSESAGSTMQQESASSAAEAKIAPSVDSSLSPVGSDNIKLAHMAPYSNFKGILKNGFYNLIDRYTFAPRNSSYPTYGDVNKIVIIFDTPRNLVKEETYRGQPIPSGFYALSLTSEVSEEEARKALGDKTLEELKTKDSKMGHLPRENIDLIETIKTNKERTKIIGEGSLAIATFREMCVDIMATTWASDEAKRLAAEAASSPLMSDIGGIDLRALPIVTQPMPAMPGVNLSAPPLSQHNINLDTEWQEIQNMLNAGIIPSCQRIKEYLEVSCQSRDCSQRIDNVLSCLADILRLEEDRVASTEPVLKELLVLLESDKQASEMQLALTKITVSPKEPRIVAP